MSEIDELGIRLTGHFALSAGLHSDTYLQCATALAQPSIALRLGRALAERVDEPVDVVASPALGGVLAGFAVAAALDRRFVFAERTPGGAFSLRRGQTIQARQRVLVVEDVITTGRSASEVAALVERAGGVVVGFACLVDRSRDFRATCLFRVQAAAWSSETCRLCAAGVPLDRPGSRAVTTSGS